MMIRLLSAAVLGLGVVGCASYSPKAGLQPSTATAFADYGPAMAHQDGYQMAYEWQQANPAAVRAATEPKVLADFVSSAAAADALLAQVGSAYDGDPIVLTQIAAVTQLVMTPGCPKAAQARSLWVAALKRAKAGASEDYVRTFCDQQLRLCK